MSDYFDIAEKDYEYLIKISGTSDYCNPEVIQCQQVSEKYLKSLVEYVCPESERLRTHSLKVLNNTLLENSVDLLLSKRDLSYLGDMYFDARCPGDNYTDVSKDDLSVCLDIMNTIRDKVIEWRSANIVNR